MGVFKGFFLILLLILLIPLVRGVVFKEAFWNETKLTLTMDQWTSVPTSDFHVYQGHEETQTWYCGDQAEECRPLWKLVLEDLGIENIVFGWYENQQNQGECERGLCTPYLTDEEIAILEEDGFSKECDDAWLYPCSGIGKYTDCVNCLQREVSDCTYGKWRWEVKCQGTCKYGGHEVGACELIDNFCFDHRQLVELEDTCAHYKHSLSQDNLGTLLNHTRCWIHITQASNGGTDFQTNVLIEGEPSTKDDYLSCLIDYDDWQEHVNSADQLSPGNKVYFDFKGNNLDIPDAPEDPAERPGPCENITCKDYCENSTFYSGVCEDGVCEYETEENSTNCSIEEPEIPGNSTNSTEAGMINCSVIARHGIEAIETIQEQLALAALSSDAEVVGTTMETTECFTDVLLNTLPLHSTYENSSDFIRNFLEPVITDYFNATLSPVFNEQGFETVVTDLTMPQINAAKQNIQNQSFNKIPDTDFVKDTIAYIDFQADEATKQREKIDFAIDSGNWMKLTMRVTKLVADVARIVLLGKTQFKTIGLAELVENANDVHTDAEECVLEGVTQPKINYVLTLFMRNFVGNTPFYVKEVERAVLNLNSMTEHPSINVTILHVLPNIFVTNTYEKELQINTQLRMDTQIQGYCNGLTSKTSVPYEPLIKWVYNTISPGDTWEINLTTPVYFTEEINKLNLESYCIEKSACFATNSNREVRIEGSGNIYVFYGENIPFAVKSIPVKRVLKVHDCKPPKPKRTAVSSGGGGGGGGGSSRPRNTQPAVLTKPVTGPSLAEKWAGGEGSAVTSPPEPVLKTPEKKPEPPAKTKEKKQEIEQPKDNLVLNTVKSIGNLLIKTVLPWLNWLNLF